MEISFFQGGGKGEIFMEISFGEKSFSVNAGSIHHSLRGWGGGGGGGGGGGRGIRGGPFYVLYVDGMPLFVLSTVLYKTV